MKRKMFIHRCFILITSLCWQHVASRHIAHQPFYPSYPDYSYMYSGLGPFHQLHSPFFTPPGTYFDQRQGILRPFPGGGVPVLVDHHKRCSDNFIGLRAHPDQQQYYYVCKPDCVIFGKCQNLQIFNATNSQCAQHPPPEYIPSCTGVGRFPLYSDCHLYIKCEKDLKPKIHSCPFSMVFSPASKKCIKGDKCTPTQISPHSSYIPEICANKFPPCFESGTFRSPSDCSLYYKCDLKKNGFYMQTRSKCSQGKFYDLQKKDCLPAKEVPCDCIQVAELVYPKSNNSPFEPPVYPEHFDLDSIVDSQYPVEGGREGVTDISKNCNEATSETVPETAATTASTPFEVDEKHRDKNDTAMEIFSHFIEEADKSTDHEDLMMVTREISGTSEEGSGFEPDFKETSVQPASTVTEQDSTTATTAATEETTEPATTSKTDKETTAEPTTTTEKEELRNQFPDWATATTSKENEITEDEEATKVGGIPPPLEPDACKNLIESGEISDADTQAQDPSQTQTKTCLTKHTSISLNTVTAELTKTTNRPDIQNEQNSNTLTTKTHKRTTKSTITTKNHISDKTLATIPEEDINSEENVLDSALSLEKIANEHATQQPEAEEIEHPMTTLPVNMQTTRIRSINTNSLEEDISYEDLLESEITKKTKAEFVEPKLNAIVDEEQNFAADTTTRESPRATTIKPSTATTSKNSLFPAIGEQSTDLPLSEEEDESDFLDSEIKIDNFESVTALPEDFNENILLNEEFLLLAGSPTAALKSSGQKSISTNRKFVTLRQADFSDEDFIPVQSKNPTLNQIKEQENSLFEKGFDDDYTTVLAEKEITTTTFAPTVPSKILLAKEEDNEITLFDKLTTLKRRQTANAVKAMQTTTQISVTAETFETSTSVNEQLKSHKTEEKMSTIDKESDGIGVLDAEIVVPGQGPEDKDKDEEEEEEEVSNNEITSAETIQTTTNSDQENKSLSQTPSTTPTTQIVTTADLATTTTTTTTVQPSEKQTNSFTIHIREEKAEQNIPTLDSSPPRKSLYYILKTKPVINSNNNGSKTDNELVTATQDLDSDSGEIPRLKIVAERPIDIQFSICPSTCNKDHKLNTSMTGKRAVLLKWFARKSKQTMGFETANETNMDKE